MDSTFKGRKYCTYDQNMHLQMQYCLAICCKQSFMYSDKKASSPPLPPMGLPIKILYIIDNWQLHNKYDPSPSGEDIAEYRERG